MNDLSNYRRPEVKGAVFHRGAVWLATLGGLFRWRDQHGIEAVPDFAGRAVRALAAAPEGVLLALDEHGAAPLVCDETGAVVRRLPALPMGEAKSLLVHDGVVFAGGKTGIWRLDGERWTAVQGGRPYEVIGLSAEASAGGERILAFVKKQGALAQPALAVSADGGDSWRHVYEGSYADLARAAAGDLVVTQWGGAHRLGEAPPPRKEPVTAAAIGAGTVALLGGSKLELLHGSRVRLEIKHPAFADADILLSLGGRILLAGPQGALLVDLVTGAIDDLFRGVAVPPHAAKIKRLFALGGRLAATASFGTFIGDVVESASPDWRPAAADWDVLDAVGVAQAPDGVWWLAAQRGLFTSRDSGGGWKHVKATGFPHGFAELTGLAFAGERLALATKAGLFLSDEYGVKDLRALPAFGRKLIDGVAADGRGRLLIAAAGELFRLDPAGRPVAQLDGGAVERLGPAPAGAAPVVDGAGAAWLAGKAGLFHLNVDDGPDGGALVVAVEATAGKGETHAVAGPAGVLVWRGEAAWFAGPGGAEWRPLAAWPAGVKSAALCGGAAFATDRSAVYRLNLPQ